MTAAHARRSPAAMKIGVISDTHGLLRPEVVAGLAGVERILHAGDIGAPEIIVRLKEIAPVDAVKGNVDRGSWASAYPDRQVVTLAGRTVYLLHNLREMAMDPAAAGFDIVVSGHSHEPKIETRDGVLYLNPGSAGPRRFSLPISFATLEIAGDVIEPRIHAIG